MKTRRRTFRNVTQLAHRQINQLISKNLNIYLKLACSILLMFFYSQLLYSQDCGDSCGLRGSNAIFSICPVDTDLGTFNCTNLDAIPAPPADIAAVINDYGFIIDLEPSSLCGTAIIESIIDSEVPDGCNDVTITRTITILDDCNGDGMISPTEDSQVCTFIITIVGDNEAPVFTVLDDGVLPCQITEPVAPDEPTVTDNCGVDVAVAPLTNAIFTGDCITGYMATFTYGPVTDICGNVAPAQNVVITTAPCGCDLETTINTCDDGDCNTEDGTQTLACDGSVCVACNFTPIDPPTCDDSNCNTADSYDAATCTCVNDPIDPPTCDDSNCNTADSYDSANCVCVNDPIDPPNCDDNDCNTADSYDSANCVCVNDPIDPPNCDDSNCNTADSYDSANCVCVNDPIDPPNCDDNDCNTADSYDSANCVCINDPIDPPNCDDSNCNTADSYDSANCVCVNDPIDPPNCDDNDCNTADSYDSANCVCVNDPIDPPNCDDNDCNTADSYDAANCVCVNDPIDPPNCDDNDCNTADSYDAANCVCVNDPIDPPNCDDNDCNTADSYDAANCVCVNDPIDPPNCDDNDCNTADSYDSANCTCVNDPIVPSEPCTDDVLDFSQSGYSWPSGSFHNSYEVQDQHFDIQIIDSDHIVEHIKEEGAGLMIGTDPHSVHDKAIVMFNLSQSTSNVKFTISDLDYKKSYHGSNQQEAVSIVGYCNGTKVYPKLRSLSGSVHISGNYAAATADSKHGYDESIEVIFNECVDKIKIKYGTGPNSPVHNPTYGKIYIGKVGGILASTCDSCNGCEESCEKSVLNFKSNRYNWHQNSTSGTYIVNDQSFNISIDDNDNILEDTEEYDASLKIGIDPNTKDDEVEVRYKLGQTSDEVKFVIRDLDYKHYGNNSSNQQEKVCVIGYKNGTQVLPVIKSLDGSVDVECNCAEATENSAHGDDESIEVCFNECIDEVLIVYGSGSNVPVDNPTYSKIYIGDDYGFLTQYCEDSCTDAESGSNGGSPKLGKAELKYEIYPNPATNLINFRNLELDNLISISITNIKGQVLKEIPLNKNTKNFSIDINDIPSGVYLLNVQTALSVSSTKIIID